MDNTELINNTGSVEEATETEKKTYTEEELQELLQREGDRRVSQALKKREQQQREADRLRDMDADQRREYDYQQRLAALEAKEKEFAMLENKQAAVDVLINKGLDTALVDLVVDSDADIMNDRIKLLEKAFKKSVKAEVENRLKSKTPVQTVDTSKSYSTKDFSKMSMKEMAELYREAPENFNNN